MEARLHGSEVGDGGSGVNFLDFYFLGSLTNCRLWFDALLGSEASRVYRL
jgi:hypothetical protein